MKLARKCREHAVALREMAEDAPDLEQHLLHIADGWMTVATLREKFYASVSPAEMSKSVQ